MARLVFQGTLFALAILCATAPAGAQKPPSAAEGETLALRWCSSCHFVSAKQQAHASDTAPSFASIAARPEASAGTLRAIIHMPYPRMPEITLSQPEVDDIVAYILSLKQR
ncbi:MAG: c-type cytochrome [Rhodospirillaceae bacterium]|nr:c-type cytochrome [Rhodospirillaceae bacterium]